ncbi:MAG TPA: hypothetical protein VK509_20740 [Polyangiales bacterium]|nr:hypothetical protein [Polyangiales bacterium]
MSALASLAALSATWNARYLAYATAHGEPDPDAMLASDRERYPGGHMAGFSAWMSGRWQAWDASRPAAFAGDRDHRSPAEHAAFDAWLATGSEAGR